MTNYSKPALLAIGVGVAATGGALAILLADPVTTGNWKLDHYLLPIVVTITIGAGHLFGAALRDVRLLGALGFLMIFGIGTGLTIYSSVGAQKTGSGAQLVADAKFHNDAIREKTADRDLAKTRLGEAQQMVKNEMTGEVCGRKCKDWKQRAKEVQALVNQYDGELLALGAPQVTPSKARPFAEAMGVLGFDAGKIEHIASAFEPFAYSLLFELTAIVAFGFGFGGRHQTQRQPKAGTPPKVGDETGKVVQLPIAAKVAPIQATSIEQISDEEAAKLRDIFNTPKARVIPADVVFKKRDAGMKQQDIAAELGTNQGRISEILSGKRSEIVIH